MKTGKLKCSDSTYRHHLRVGVKEKMEKASGGSFISQIARAPTAVNYQAIDGFLF